MPAGTAGGGEPPKKRGAGRVLGIIGLVVVLTAGAVGAWAFLGNDEAAAAEVELEAIGEAGDDPFTDPVAPAPAGSLQEFASGTNEVVEQVSDQVGDYRSPDGSIPGIYGGSLNEAACNPDQLVAFLAQDADKAGVWAEVVGIDTQDIPDYVARLTPVNLGADTRVVDHGFRDGEARERQVVLQRGSAVLVDPQGTPRVDCYSGSPLANPEPIEDEDFVGEAWAGFGTDRVVVIVAAPSELQAFDLQDVSTGELFSRPVGSRGDADVGGEQEPAGDDSATRDLVEDGPIEFDTVYEDAITEQRPQARYLLDAPDGAIMTFRISNARESQSRVQMQVLSDGDRYVSTRISPGADDEATIVVDHDGGAPFELLFNEGPAEFTYEVELQTQVDAGQDGDAGDDFSTGRDITPGQVEGMLGGQDGKDVYLLDAVPGAELLFEAAVDRASERRARFEIHFNGERLYSNRVNPAADAQTSILLNGEDEGVLEIHVDEGPAIYGFAASFVEAEDGGQAGDAGNELVDARDLEVGTELTGEVGGRDPADWYLFELPADRIEIPVAVSTDSDRRVRVRIQGPDGSNVGGGRINPGSDDVFEIEGEPGDEYRIVFDEGRASYTFQLGSDGSSAADDGATGEDEGSEDE